MTEQKLWKFLNRPASPPPFGPIHFTPVLLSDSQGKYLKEFLGNSVVENRVQFWYKGSSTTRQTFECLRDNIDRKIQRHGPLWIYIWVGTCDLTTKNGDYIHITSESDNSTVSYITEYYQLFADLINSRPNCKYTFLETPVFSIQYFNESRDHPDPKEFKNQDKELQGQIYELNGYIQQTNTANNTKSPLFSADLCRRSNYRLGYHHRHSAGRATYNFFLYSDGIHPERILSQVWLRKTLMQMKTDCW